MEAICGETTMVFPLIVVQPSYKVIEINHGNIIYDMPQFAILVKEGNMGTIGFRAARQAHIREYLHPEEKDYFNTDKIHWYSITN